MDKFESLHSIVAEFRIRTESLELFDLEDLAACDYAQSYELTYPHHSHVLPLIVDNDGQVIGVTEPASSVNHAKYSRSCYDRSFTDATESQEYNLTYPSCIPKAVRQNACYPLAQQTYQSDDSRLIDSDIGSSGSQANCTQACDQTHPSSIFEILTSKGETLASTEGRVHLEGIISSLPNILTSDDLNHDATKGCNQNHCPSSDVILNSEPYL